MSRVWLFLIASFLISAGAKAATTSVSILGISMAYSPANVTINRGDTVTWTNKDTITHTVTSNTSVFNSGNMGANATFSFTFNNPGSFPYHCSIHLSMTGTI